MKALSPPLRSHHHWRRHLPVAVMVSISAVALTVPWRKILLWNVTPSVPQGLYLIRQTSHLRRDDLAVAWLPTAPRQLASARRYLPSDVPIVKPIAALNGDTVCRTKNAITINGTVTAIAFARDSQARALPKWSGCRTLAAEDYLLLNPQVATSFDGRYFGPVRVDAIIGEALPLFTKDPVSGRFRWQFPIHDRHIP